jgi:hypothetical protein
VAAYSAAMTLVPPHRKRVPHFHEPGQYHELTFFSKSKGNNRKTENLLGIETSGSRHDIAP